MYMAIHYIMWGCLQGFGPPPCRDDLKLIEIMTSYPLIMKTLAQAFICLSHTSLYKLVCVTCGKVAGGGYKVVQSL